MVISINDKMLKWVGRAETNKYQNKIFKASTWIKVPIFKSGYMHYSLQTHHIRKCTEAMKQIHCTDWTHILAVTHPWLVRKPAFLWWLSLESLADLERLSTSSDTLDLLLVLLDRVLAGDPGEKCHQQVFCLSPKHPYLQPHPAMPGTASSQTSTCPTSARSQSTALG